LDDLIEGTDSQVDMLAVVGDCDCHRGVDGGGGLVGLRIVQVGWSEGGGGPLEEEEEEEADKSREGVHGVHGVHGVYRVALCALPLPVYDVSV